MSAYIVSPETINAVVTFLNLKPSEFRHLLHSLGYLVDQHDDLQRLAEDLYILNCDAVDGRYGHGTAARDEDGKPLHRFSFVTSVSTMQVYKSAQCLLYQCSEDPVMERPLYALLSKVVDRIAHHMVQSMEGYNTAKWG